MSLFASMRAMARSMLILEHAEETRMRLPQAHATRLTVRIGGELLPIEGSLRDGWIVGADDGATSASGWYASLDELVFALINLSVTADGSA